MLNTSKRYQESVWSWVLHLICHLYLSSPVVAGVLLTCKSPESDPTISVVKAAFEKYQSSCYGILCYLCLNSTDKNHSIKIPFKESIHTFLIISHFKRMTCCIKLL